MKLLVFGKTGQVATALGQYAGVALLGRDQADLTNPDICAAIIQQTGAHAVINAAAFTAVDLAETQEPLATKINADAPKAMAQACAARGLPFLHISTDYVFDGSGQKPWQPDDAISPQNAYGRSKYAGEVGVINAGGTYAILRTSWVFSATGNNFVKTMLKLAQQHSELKIVNDQFGGPTAAADIAAVLVVMAGILAKHPEKSGVYHFSGAPSVSWLEFARCIFEKADLPIKTTGIPSAQYPTPAARPLNSRLSCASLEQAFGIKQPDWRLALDKVLTQLKASS